MRKIVTILFTVCVVVFVFSFFKNKSQENSQEIKATEKPLSALTIVDISPKCKLYIQVNSDSIWVEMFENVCSDAKSFSIEKTRYPYLFKQGVANESFISVEKTTDPNFTLLVSNNQPDHGGYSPTYQLMVNPKTMDIKEVPKNP